jgi:hypothetical protein
VIVDESCGGHWQCTLLGFRQCEPHILDRQRHNKPRRTVTFLQDLAAISFVDLGIEQRIGQGEIRNLPAGPDERTGAEAPATDFGEARRGPGLAEELPLTNLPEPVSELIASPHPPSRAADGNSGCRRWRSPPD